MGVDALSPRDQLTMETAKVIREDYLHQNAFHEIDTYASLGKQFRMLKLIYDFHQLAGAAIEEGAELDDILALTCKERIGRAKYIPETELEKFDEISRLMNAQIKTLMHGDSDNDERI